MNTGNKKNINSQLNCELINFITKAFKEFIPQLGQEILVKQTEGFEVSVKVDGSKVTSADLLAEEKIIDFINDKFANHFEFAIISEERENASLTNDLTWTIDPIDGTHSYIEGKENFSIMVGLLENKRPVWGMIYLPAKNYGYYAFNIFESASNKKASKGAYKFFNSLGKIEPLTDKPIKVSLPVKNHTLVMNRPGKPLRDWEEKLIKHFNITEIKNMGSLGIKMAVIAEGTAHYYFSLKSQFGIWDLVPSIIILEQAGGFVTDIKGNSLVFEESNGKYKDGLVGSYQDQYSELKELIFPYL